MNGPGSNWQDYDGRDVGYGDNDFRLEGRDAPHLLGSGIPRERGRQNVLRTSTLTYVEADVESGNQPWVFVGCAPYTPTAARRSVQKKLAGLPWKSRMARRWNLYRGQCVAAVLVPAAVAVAAALLDARTGNGRRGQSVKFADVLVTAA
ncbi:unnamed protein product [Pedinophyceae sp. YPF-701]|nr:unnamed protein product [Pedinophyceae sp. YPF-701]